MAGGFARMRPLRSILPIVLAAGDSTRMGYPKALLPLGEELFITRILRVLRNAELPRPVIILGRAAAAIQPRIQDWPADILINSDPDRGQLSSIQLAFAHVAPEYAGGMIWPVDQPAVSENLVRRLAELFLSSESRIVFPKCGGKSGHPAIFHRDLFQEFMDAPLKEGPKSILLRHQQETIELTTEESAAVQDIDTPSDYLELTGKSLQATLAKTDIV
jgi:molybdenum cofactor cytidylyltransferase